MAVKSFKQRQFELREDAILDGVNRLLTTRGYDLMTMEELAADVGVAKGSLYKHFPSKESLAAAAMTRLLKGTREYLNSLPAAMPAIDRLKSLLSWALRMRIEGGMPTLPSTSPALQASLLSNDAYVAEILGLNQQLTALLEEAREHGHVRASMPTDVALHTIYARTCDPSLDFLRMTGNYDDETVIKHIVSACFDGIVGAADTTQSSRQPGARRASEKTPREARQ